MPYSLSETPTRREILLALQAVDTTPEERAEIISKFALAADPQQVNELSQLEKRANEEAQLLYQLYNEKLVARNKSAEELRETLTNAANSYTIKLEVPWIDEQFFEHFTTTDEQRRVWLKMNTLEEFTEDERNTANELQYHFKDESDVTINYQVGNAVFPKYEDGLTGFFNDEYELDLEHAQTIAEDACAYWRGERDTRFGSKDIYASGEGWVGFTMTASRVRVGCQSISKRDVIRIAALMGWAGFEKQAMVTVLLRSSLLGTSGRDPCWLDASLLKSIVPDCHEEVARLFTTLNAGGPILYAGNREILEGLYTRSTLHGRSYDRMTTEEKAAWHRITNLVYVDGQRVRGAAYSMGVRAAQDLADWVVPLLLEGAEDGQEYHLGHQDAAYAYYRNVPGKLGIEMGCQFITKEEIFRLCALQGWAGFEKQTGPAVEVPKAQAEPAKPPMLELPLQAGDKVRLRNGTEAEVERVTSRGLAHMVGGDVVFASTGTHYQNLPEMENDVVETISRTSDPQLPLQTNDTVKLRDGTFGTVVSVSSDGGDLAYLTREGSRERLAVFQSNGRGNQITDRDFDVMRIVYRSVPEAKPDFPLQVGDIVQLENGSQGKVVDTSTIKGRDGVLRYAVKYLDRDGLFCRVNLEDGKTTRTSSSGFNVVKVVERPQVAEPAV